MTHTAMPEPTSFVTYIHEGNAYRVLCNGAILVAAILENNQIDCDWRDLDPELYPAVLAAINHD